MQRAHVTCASSYDGRRLNAARDVTRLLGFNEGKEALVAVVREGRELQMKLRVGASFWI